MQLDRIRRTALAVAVLSAVGAIAASAGAHPTAGGAFAADSSLGSTGASTGASGSSGASGPTGSSASTSTSGATGATALTGASGATGASGGLAGGGTGATGATAVTSPPGVTGATSAAASSTGPTAVTGASGTTGTTGTTAATGSTGPTAASGALAPPTIIGSGAQPLTGVTHPSARHRHHHHHHPHPHRGSGSNGSPGASVSGPTAPPPNLFTASNPLAGVLPGSWVDPFIVSGGAEVPQFYVDSFHIPPFLLSIYQAAAAAYGIPWQTLAAINEVETDYGTNLNVSSAGAIGWMQFLPSTWKRYGVDASASGARDPYNAADAIFAAARYLAAAGATHNLPGAIFAYNHSVAYVQSVLLRAQLLSGEPSALVNSVTELAEGDFPIQLSYHARYRPASEAPAPSAANGATALTGASGATGNAPSPSTIGAAAAQPTPHRPAAELSAASNAAVVAVQDGTIVTIGHNRRLGRFVVERNAFGASFTYANLASVSAWYPTPKRPHASAQILSAAAPAALASGPRPIGAPASAGGQSPGNIPAAAALFRPPAKASSVPSAAPAVPVLVTLDLRSRPAAVTVFTPVVVRTPAKRKPQRPPRAVLARYLTGALGLRPSQLELARLTIGSHVLAGTILGRLARTAGGRRPHLVFELRPPGAGQSLIDPRPFLDAWSQLETLELRRQSYGAPFYGPNLHSTSVGALLLTSQVDIERIVLQDTRVSLPGCERTAIAAGNVDRRVLASLEVLVTHGIDPAVSGAWCATAQHKLAIPAALKTGDAIALTALNGRGATGRAATGAVAALGVLRGGSRPVLSERTIPGQLIIAFAPAHQPQALAASASFTTGFALSTPRWAQLDTRLQHIREPRVPTAISTAALRDPGHHATARSIQHPSAG